MTQQRTSIRFGLGVGGFGAVANVLTVFVLFTLPQQLLGEATASAFLERWFGPVSTVGGGLAFYVTPVLAGVVAFYLVTVVNVTVEEALVGFAVGGLAFGLAVTLTGWVVTSPTFRSSTLEYVVQTGRFTARVLGPAFAGALVGTVVRNRR